MRSTPSFAIAMTAALVGALLSATPAQSATPAAPGDTSTGAADDATVRLTGTLLSTAVERPGDRPRHAVRVGDGFVPVAGPTLAAVTPGSTVTLDVTVPQHVVDAAEAGRSLRIPSAVGGPTTHDLDPADVDSATDDTPAAARSAIGRATTDAATAPSSPDLEVTEVVSTAAARAASYAPATRKITYVAVTPRGLTREPVTTTTARAQVASTDAYWRDNSRATLKVGAPTMRPQYTSALRCSSAGPFDFWNEAIDRTGWTWEDNSTLVLNFPRSADAAGCGYGYGIIGTTPNDGGPVSVADTAWPVLAHEIGHNMSLNHANWLTCPGRTDTGLVRGDWPATCTEHAYEDGLDIMSYSDQVAGPMLSTPQALLTGMLEPSAATTAGHGTTTVTLKPLSGRTGTRAAVATDVVTKVKYYVEYRTASGRDSANPTGSVPGVRVLRMSPSGSSALLDPTPNDYPDANAVVAPGRSMTNHDRRITVTTVSATAAEAVVRITNDRTLPPFVSTSAPTITGTRGVGSRLTATKGTWSPTPSGYSYQWRRNGTAISGATASTYTPKTADAGRYLSVTVTPRRTGYASTSVTSGRVGIPIHATTRPYLRGNPRLGNTMSVMVGTWTPTPTSYAYQWYRNGSAISGASAKTYPVRSADRGKRLQAKVTARRSGYSTGQTYTFSSLVP